MLGHRKDDIDNGVHESASTSKQAYVYCMTKGDVWVCNTCQQVIDSWADVCQFPMLLVPFRFTRILPHTDSIASAEDTMEHLLATNECIGVYSYSPCCC